MNIQIPDTDVPIVRETLEASMKRLLEEIVHADQRAYRQELKERYERLERIRREVEFAAEAANVTA